MIFKIKNTEIVKSSQEIAQKFDSEKKDEVIQQLENENQENLAKAVNSLSLIYSQGI